MSNVQLVATNGFALMLVLCLSLTAYADDISVTELPDEMRTQFSLDPFYTKYSDAEGLPVVGSSKVSDEALAEATWIVLQMLGHRKDILKAMAKNQTRLAVMAHDEYTTDVPEHRHLKPKDYWDRRARGLGATRHAPAVSCAEENLLCFPGDPYSSENICIHEFAHAIHEMGMHDVDATFDDRLKAAFDRAKQQGLWKDTYAATNRQEYWAEGVQCWFDNNRESDNAHNHINTRDELRSYDPQLASLCESVFGNRTWRYQKPLDRKLEERSHLKSFDFSRSPKFRWRSKTQ